MENNKKVDKIQLEYDLYECSEIDTIDRTIKILYVNFEEIDVARSYIDLEKKRNRRKRFISGLLGRHAEKFGYLDPYYYDMDDAYLERKLDVLNSYYGQLNAIHGEIDDYNYQELYRLMNFARTKSKEYRIAIQEERDEFRKTASGERSGCPKYKDESSQFAEWFSGALDVASYTESVEKVKK